MQILVEPRFVVGDALCHLAMNACESNFSVSSASAATIEDEISESSPMRSFLSQIAVNGGEVDAISKAAREVFIPEKFIEEQKMISDIIKEFAKTQMLACVSLVDDFESYEMIYSYVGNSRMVALVRQAGCELARHYDNFSLSTELILSHAKSFGYFSGLTSKSNFILNQGLDNNNYSFNEKKGQKPAEKHQEKANCLHKIRRSWKSGIKGDYSTITKGERGIRAKNWNVEENDRENVSFWDVGDFKGHFRYASWRGENGYNLSKINGSIISRVSLGKDKSKLIFIHEGEYFSYFKRFKKRKRHVSGRVSSQSWSSECVYLPD